MTARKKPLKSMQPPVISTTENWPQPVVPVLRWRQDQLKRMRKETDFRKGALAYYRANPVPFILDWCDTYDPRNAGSSERLTRMPFLMFKRQCEFIEYLEALRTHQEGGLVEKCRDVGATWAACSYSAWLWRFHPGSSIGWGSRKESLVDKLGDPDSIFEKLRMTIKGWPKVFWPRGFSVNDHMHFMRIVNPENDSTITGEAGDNIGRGGRKTMYFKDESAHYERPEKIEAALADNTNVQVDISSVNGIGNVFHRRREGGREWARGEPMEKGKTQVFIFDWRDHPAKTQEWYDQRKRKAEDEGLSHVFAQEVDRDYAAAVEGIIIQPEWIDAAVDAHIKLDISVRGKRVSALDVADTGGDANAQVFRRGILLEEADQWGDRDTGSTTRRALMGCRKRDCDNLQYDSIGVGAGVRAEANRLLDDPAYKLHPVKVEFIPWNGGAAVLEPDGYVVPGDKESAKNADTYANLKAQAWWRLRWRFYRTWKAVTDPAYRVSADELISLSSRIKRLQTLKKELAQPTSSPNGAMKLVVDKTPEGSKSPNLGDATVMAFNPVQPKRKTRRRTVVMG